MNLDNIAVTLRPRNGWQSIDLGFKLARGWFLPLFVLWLSLSVPVYLLCKFAGLPGWLVLFAWWWFKPLYEAPLYFWCSRAVFAEPITIRQALSAVPRKILPLLSTYLLFWRLGTARSQNMNVIMIENLKGKARSNRISVISRVTTRTDPLVFVCVHIEVAFAYSMMLIGYLMLPDNVTENALWLTLIGQADSFWLATSLEVSAIIAAGIVAPFYVCAGFSLYINRRTHLEAWDIDLHFRRLINRQGEHNEFTRKDPDQANNKPISSKARPGPTDTNLLDRQASTLGEQTRSNEHTTGQASEESANKRGGNPPSIAASILGVIVISCCLLPPKAHAAVDSNDPLPDDQTSHVLINEILEHKDFGVTTSKKKLQFIEREEEPEENTNWDFEWDWLNGLIEFLKRVSDVALWVEGVLWLLVGVLFTWLVYLVARNRHQFSRIQDYFGFRRSTASQVQLFDLDIAPKSLPDDISATARQLLVSGQSREAMSLLYRGALSRLVHRYGMQITDSATERECVEQVYREQPGARREVFNDLTRHWLQVAYGRCGVSDDQINALCDKWPHAFDSAALDSAACDPALNIPAETGEPGAVS